MTRGHRGSLLLRCRALSSPSPCRFIPALSATSHTTRAAARSGAPVEHCRDHALAGPAPRDRTRVARLAIGVGVPLPVARLRVRAAAAAYAHVSGLDRPGLFAGRIVEVRLYRRRRTPEPIRDVSDRESLGLAEVARQSDRPATLENPIRSGGSRLARHARSRYLGSLAFSPGSASKRVRTELDSLPAREAGRRSYWQECPASIASGALAA